MVSSGLLSLLIVFVILIDSCLGDSESDEATIAATTAADTTTNEEEPTTLTASELQLADDELRTEELNEDFSTTTTETTTTTTSSYTTTPPGIVLLAGRPKTKSKNVFFDMEILSLKVSERFGNAVELYWGEPARGYNLNWTYGVYYGLSIEEALNGPQVTTKDLHATVHNLTYCTQYFFAVGIVDDGIGRPPTNFRSIGTFINETSPPKNLQIDFLPGDQPCLLVTWSASCANVARPLGYLVTVFEKGPSRMTIITEPETTAVDLSQTLRVVHGKSYDIKVSTDVIGSNSTEILSYGVPLFLQPFKVRLTSTPDGTFVMYWREPYVPRYIGPYFYEVYVYPGLRLGMEYTKHGVNKPIFTFKGNTSEYTFMVGLRSCDGAFKSYLTDPIAKSLYGDAIVLDVE